jgi:hypothetical protein
MAFDAQCLSDIDSCRIYSVVQMLLQYDANQHVRTRHVVLTENFLLMGFAFSVVRAGGALYWELIYLP